GFHTVGDSPVHEVDWVNPDQGAGAPIASVSWTLCPVEPVDPCSSGVLDGPAQALSFSDERAERYALQVRLTDAAGNTDPANTASFTFDRDGSGSGSVVDSKLKIDHVARRGRRYAITAFLDPRTTRPVHFALTRRAGAKTVLISRADAASHT